MNKIFYKFKRATQTMSTALKTTKVAVAIALMTLTAMQAHAQGTGSGTTEADPRLVNTFAQLKTALESSSITYVRVNGNINYNFRDDAFTHITGGYGIQVTGTKTLLLDNNVYTHFGGQLDSTDPRMIALIAVHPGHQLTVTGSGTLSASFNDPDNQNAVITVGGKLDVINGTIKGVSAFQWRGIAIWGSATSVITIFGGSFSGETGANAEYEYGGSLGRANFTAAVRTTGKLTIKGGDFVCKSIATDFGGVYSWTPALYINSSQVELSGGTFRSILSNNGNISASLASGSSIVNVRNRQ